MFLWRISNSDFFGIARREGGRNVMTKFGPAEWGYLGFGNCVFLRDKHITKKLRRQDRKIQRVKRET